MAVLVHLADERNVASIKRSGLKGLPREVWGAEQTHKIDKAVFVTPVLPSYSVTHQWLRELKRRGMRTLIAVHIKLPSDEMVWLGRYAQEHRFIPLGHAIGLFMAEKNPLGWEIIVPHSIGAKSIHAIRPAPQVAGWRYMPDARERGVWTCMCEGCLSLFRDGIKSARLRRSLLSPGGKTTSFEGDEKLRRRWTKPAKRTSKPRGLIERAEKN